VSREAAEIRKQVAISAIDVSRVFLNLRQADRRRFKSDVSCSWSGHSAVPTYFLRAPFYSCEYRGRAEGFMSSRQGNSMAKKKMQPVTKHAAEPGQRAMPWLASFR
jgi:hypothetical protein